MNDAAMRLAIARRRREMALILEQTLVRLRAERDRLRDLLALSQPAEETAIIEEEAHGIVVVRAAPDDSAQGG